MPANKRANGRRLDEDLVMSPTVLAFDPGGTTGWSVMSVHPEALVDPELSVIDNIEHWEHGQIACNLNGQFDVEAENNGVAEMVGLAEAWPGSAIVIEDYILRNSRKDRETLTPVRLIAAINFGLWQLHMGSWRQQPSEAKGRATDDRLRIWNLYERSGGMQHARDADRHAITAIFKSKQRPGLRARFWPHLYTGQGELKD